MKQLLPFIFSIGTLLFCSMAYGQGGAINTTGSAADPSAMLDVSATDKGVLIPRMTEAQRDAISSPANGLLIYQTDNSHGFYFYDATIPAWVQIGSGGGSSSNMTFTLTADTNAVTGGTGTATTASLITLTLTLTGGDGSPVNLTASGLPAGVVALFSPSGGYPSFTSELYFDIAATTTPGVYPIVISANGAPATPTVNITLNVIAVKLAFLSSTTYQGNFGGVSTADTECQNLATAAGLSGSYKAWICDGNSSNAPASRFTQSSDPYSLRNSTIIANNWSDLTDNTLDNNFDVNEDGTILTSTLRTWSNVWADGTQFDNNHCSNWTSTGGQGRTGVPDRPWNSDWTGDNLYNCTSVHRLYCVQQ